jgi:hypothetical protein
MWYKFEQNEWFIATKIYFPDGGMIQSPNDPPRDGWQWYDEPPQAYLDWQNS